MPPLSHLTSCTPTKSNLYLANSLAAAISEHALHRLLMFHVSNKMSLFLCPVRDASLETLPSRYLSGIVFYLRIFLSSEEAFRIWVFLNFCFSWGRVVRALPTPKLEDHPLSAVRDCLFNLFAATPHIGDCSSIRNLRTPFRGDRDPQTQIKDRMQSVITCTV